MRESVVAAFVLAAAFPKAVSAATPGETPPPSPLATTTPIAPPPPPAFTPDLRARIFVKDLDHLSELVKEDPAVAVRARALADRQRASFAVGGVGVVAGLVVSVIGMTQQTCDSQPTGFPGGGTFQTCRFTGGGLVAAGGILMAGGAVAAILLHPRRGDLLDVVNAWNSAHRDQPIDLYPVPAMTVAAGVPAEFPPAPPAADSGPRLVVPATGGPPVMAIPLGGGLYLPVTGGPPVPGTPVTP